MNDRTETRIITAALPFANNLPHLGNIVGSHLPADIFARYCRLRGYRTIFVGGMDEYGAASELAAHRRGVTPQQLCNELYESHLEIYKWFNISYDNFSRTSRALHHQVAQLFCKKLFDKKLIIEGTLNTPFCDDCKKGLADRFIIGICPHCKYESANGDQCEVCGNTLEASELLQPRCVTCGNANVSFKETKHLFLDLKCIVPQIQQWLDSNPCLRRQVKKLAVGWLRQGLKLRCITRDLKWGIPVPIEGYEAKVLYVWFENVIGYISATVELLGDEGYSLWKDPSVKTFHFLAKDNIAFHTIFWPGELIGIEEYILPYNVVGLQYLTVEGKKFSKSKNIGIFSDDAVRSGIPVDYWRFYLTYLIPETADTNFSAAEFEERINSELVSKFGNLIHRALSLVWTKWQGTIPTLDNRDLHFEEKVHSGVKSVCSSYEGCELRRAVQEIFQLCDVGNEYINRAAPWKTNSADSIIYVLELARICAVLLSPVIPGKAHEVHKQLNHESHVLEFEFLPRSITEPKPIFPRVEGVSKAIFGKSREILKE